MLEMVQVCIMAGLKPHLHLITDPGLEVLSIAISLPLHESNWKDLQVAT